MRCRSVVAFAFIGIVAARIEAAGELSSDLDVVYGKGGDVELKLDLYRPADQKEELPGMLVVHGGGWRGGNKESMRPIAEQMARAGYVAATVQYRLCPKYRFPAQVEDVKCAVRWMRANAGKYRVDSNRIGALGASAGGHLVLMLGACDPTDGLEGAGGHAEYSSKVQAVANYFGPFDLTLRDWDPKLNNLLVDFVGGDLSERGADYRRASPAAYLDPKDAPVITFHGDKDPIVPYGQAVLVDKKCRETGVESHLETLEGQGHGWLGLELQRTQRMAIEFMDKRLKRTAAAPSPSKDGANAGTEHRRSRVVLADGVYPVIRPNDRLLDGDPKPNVVELVIVPVEGNEPSTPERIRVSDQPLLRFEKLAHFDFKFEKNECTQIGFRNTDALRAYTREHSGSRLAVVVDNQVISHHKIREPIESDMVRITCCTVGGGDHLHKRLKELSLATESNKATDGRSSKENGKRLKGLP